MKEVQKTLNAEWAKPKASNLRKDDDGNIVDTREPRDYNKIAELHKEKNRRKTGW